MSFSEVEQHPLSPRREAAQSLRDKAAFRHELFNIIIDHLKGTSRDTLQGRLQTQCDGKKFGGKNAVQLYKSIQFNWEDLSKQDEQDIQALIALLYPYEPHKTFDSLPDNLYACLEYFGQDKTSHRHLEDFNHLLKSVDQRKNHALTLFMLTVFTGGLGLYLYLVPQHFKALEAFIYKTAPIVAEFLKSTFSILKNIPLLLMVYNMLTIPVQLYASYYDTFRSPWRRFQRWLVGTLPAALTLTAYLLSYLAGGVFTPLAASLFFASSFVEVISSAINLYLLDDEEARDISKLTSLEQRLDLIRYNHRRARTKETILVNLVAAAFVAATVTLWCIFPPSLLVMIGCIIFINLINFTRSSTLSLIHTSGAKDLQVALEEEVRYDDIPEEVSDASDKPPAPHTKLSFFKDRAGEEAVNKEPLDTEQTCTA